jgi:hypothetical protein
MTVVTAITGSNQDKNEIRSQWEGNGEPFKTFKFAIESLQGQHQATIFEQKNIGGDVGIYGNENFGIYGVSKYGTTASQSFILGLGELGLNALGDSSSSYEVVRIIPPNNLFEETFVGTYFIDSTSTTAIISGGIVTF